MKPENPERQEYLIEWLGAKGDGIAMHNGNKVHIPFTLPGEQVLAESTDSGKKYRLVSLIRSSPERIDPVCPLFTRCGGCSLQHMAEKSYRQFKEDQVRYQLKRAGLPADIQPMIDAHGSGRRRVTFHARFGQKNAVSVGFMEAGSHNLISIDSCPVLEPEIQKSASVAIHLAAYFRNKTKTLDIVIVNSQSGLDVTLKGIGYLDEKQKLDLVAISRELDLARLSNHDEILVEIRSPIIFMGNSPLVLSPGAFLQASATGEKVLAEYAVKLTHGAKKIADLFAGCGPFTLRLGHHADIHAVEGDAAMLRALEQAARQTPDLRKISTEKRDLFKRPLLVSEINNFDAIVLDPPRAGAEAQSRELAKSDMERIVYISCDAQSFARDAALLTTGGYHLETIIPVDQFRYSPHIEIISSFYKAKKKKRKLLG